MNLNATLFGEMLTFAIFVWFTMRFVWPLITAAIADRQKTIADGLAAATQGQQALQHAKQEIDLQLQQARQQASALLEQADKRAQQIVEEAKHQAKEEGQRILLAAKADIAHEVERAKHALQQRVVELAVLGAEKILTAKIDVQSDAKLLATLATEI